MTVYETDLPGVGKKFEIDVDDGERVVAVIHHDGKRDVYFKRTPDSDGEKLFSLSDSQARTVGSILSGSHFQPVDLDEVSVPVGEAIIEWTEVSADSPVVGETLADANVRQETGVSIIAIQRGDDTIANPNPDTEIASEDIVVTLGTHEDQAAFDELVDPGA